MSLPLLPTIRDFGAKLSNSVRNFVTSDESTFSQFFGVGEKKSTFLETTRDIFVPRRGFTEKELKEADLQYTTYLV